jgi:hypothetical protein
MINSELIFYCILALISMSSQIFLIYGFLRIKKMKKHPEIMIFWQCVAQIILDLHWITGLSDLHNQLSIFECKLLGAFFGYFYYLSWNYILFLSIEICIKIKYPLICKDQVRTLAYHLISHFSSLTIFLILITGDQNGESIIGTCFLQDQSVYELILLVPLILYLPVFVFVCGYTLYLCRVNIYASKLKHHVYIVIVFTLCWLPNSLVHGLNYKEFNISIENWCIIVTYT